MASYSPEPGYAFSANKSGSTLDPLVDRYTGADYMKGAPYDPMGVHGPGFGLGTDSSVMDFLDEVFQGGYGGTQSPEQFGGPGPGSEMNPQDFIRQQLAGDVVPMRLPPDYADRLTQPGVYTGTRGAAAINQMGGNQSPYLDLLNVLAFPSGRSMAPPIGRR